MISRYGRTFPEGATDLDVELMAFRESRTEPDWPNLTTRADHFRNLIAMLHSKTFEWNPNVDRIAPEICANRYTSLTGHASASKTHCVSFYALYFWLCSPLDSAVLLTSTTIPGLRRRVLGDCFAAWQTAHDPKEVNKEKQPIQIPLPGNLVSSENALQLAKGDYKHGIFGFATDDSNVQKSMQKIQGFHPRRLLVVVDEMAGTGEAIVKACMNLESGTDEFQFIGIANAESRLDPHGRFSEPEDGWNSITVDDEKWPIKRKNGFCIHLDGLKSPNILAGEPAYPYLLKSEQIENYRNEGGGDENSIEFWKFVRGFWPPESLSNTVLSDAMIVKFDALSHPIWKGDQQTKCASLDPAFEGGDKRILTLGKFGAATTGKTVLDILRQIHVPLSATSKEPIHYQIAHFVIEFCKEEGIDPRWFGLDTTGEGGGVASILVKEWSPLIHQCEFGGSPSDKPLSPETKRPARDECGYRVDELWFAVRYLLQSGHLKGLPMAAVSDFCARRYALHNNKKRLEIKADMKTRIRRSPDHGDSLVVLVDLLRKRGIFGASTPQGSTRSPLLRLAEQSALTYETVFAES